MISKSNFNIIKPNQLKGKIPDGCQNIFFWDTCGLLDILNLVINSTNDSFILTLKKIIEQIDNGNAISVTSIIVVTEIDDNYHEPYGQADKFINHTLNNYNKMMKYLVALGLVPSHTDISKNSVDFTPTIERMIQNLLNKTFFIEDDAFLKLARDRVVTKTPPGIKNEFKDCVIWETCIEVSKTREKNEKLFFISSNESDFGKNGNRYPEIDAECKIHSIEFQHKIHELYPHVN